MTQADRTPDTRSAEAEDTHPALKVYTPRLEEFEEAVAHARKQWDSLPDWLKADMKRRYRTK